MGSMEMRCGVGVSFVSGSICIDVWTGVGKTGRGTISKLEIEGRRFSAAVVLCKFTHQSVFDEHK